MYLVKPLSAHTNQRRRLKMRRLLREDDLRELDIPEGVDIDGKKGYKRTTNSYK